MNQGHRGVVELNADLPRAKPMSERGSSALATGEGGRRPLRKFGEVTRSVESMKTRERRLGGVASTIRSSVWSLRGAKLRRYGIPSAARISAAFYGSAAAAARLRVGAGGFGGAGALFKAPSTCGASQL